MIIDCIKIPGGCVVTKHDSNWLFDGEKATPTYMPNWWRLNKVPERIHRFYTEKTNERWELKFDVPNLPKTLLDEEARHWDDDEDRNVWNNPDLAPLYKYTYDTVEVVEPVEFTLNDLGTIVNFNESGSIKIPDLEVSLKALSHHLVDRIFVPEPILLNERPCEIPDYKLYPILRAYLRKHLDYEVVELKDYDDNLSVDKVIPLATPDPYTSWYMASGAKRKKPVVEYRTIRKVRVYAVYCGAKAASNAKYGFEPLPSIVAANPDELADKVNMYLEDLVAELNTPLKDCPHCKGTGVVVNDNK